MSELVIACDTLQEFPTYDIPVHTLGDCAKCKTKIWITSRDWKTVQEKILSLDLDTPVAAMFLCHKCHEPQIREIPITYDYHTLWGSSGGQLEYVSQKVVWKQAFNGYLRCYLMVRFTDHDVQATKEGEGKFYDLYFPFAALEVAPSYVRP